MNNQTISTAINNNRKSAATSPQPQYDGTSAKELLSRAQQTDDIMQIDAMYEHAIFKSKLLASKNKTMRQRLWSNAVNQLSHRIIEVKTMREYKEEKAKPENRENPEGMQWRTLKGIKRLVTAGLSSRAYREFHKENKYPKYSNGGQAAAEYNQWRKENGLKPLNELSKSERDALAKPLKSLKEYTGIIEVSYE